MDERRKREREELEALRAEADAKLRLARETLESARRKGARVRAQGVGRARGRSTRARRATSCPRRRPGRPCPPRVSSASTRSLRPPGLFGRARGLGAEG